MASVDRTTAADVAGTAMSLTVGLEPLGSDVLVEGELRTATTVEVVVATASILPVGTRAFLVIEDPSQVPVVGLVEIVDQHVIVDDVSVELRAHIVHMTQDDTTRLALLATGELSGASSGRPRSRQDD